MPSVLYAEQGDQIGLFFAHWATFGSSLLFFCRDELAKRYSNILGYSLHKQFYLHFSPNQVVSKHDFL
jgi:hypothetical protein